MRSISKSILLLFAFVAAFSLGAFPEKAKGEPLSYFKNALAPFRKLPKFIAPGPPFNARQCMKGKSMLSIPVSSANPFTKNIEDAMEAVAKEVGFKYIRWRNQGQPTQWVQGMFHGINQKVDLIDLLAGVDPRVLVPQVQAAQKAGIKVVVSHYNGLEQTPANVDFDVPIDYFKAGQLLVDWAVVQTKGKLNALMLYTTGPLSTDSMLAGMRTEMRKCATCKWTTKNILLTDWSSKIQTTTQSVLLADPTINYIIVMYDSMSQFVTPAVQITRATNRVKINAFNGTPFVIGLIQQGKVEMDIGENLDWIGHAIIDAEMRIMCGLKPVKDPKIPFFLFDENNAHTAGTPPVLSKGYGDAYIKGYRKLWGME